MASKEFNEAQRAVIEQQLREKIRERAEKALEIKVAELVQELTLLLDSRGIDTERVNFDMEAVARRTVVNEMGDSNQSKATFEVPIAGRNNGSTSVEVGENKNPDPPTKTVELPIEGGDVDDPETIEWEVPDPPAQDLNATEKILDKAARRNLDERDGIEEVDPDDVDAGGLPWYQ